MNVIISIEIERTLISQWKEWECEVEKQTQMSQVLNKLYKHTICFLTGPGFLGYFNGRLPDKFATFDFRKNNLNRIIWVLNSDCII